MRLVRTLVAATAFTLPQLALALPNLTVTDLMYAGELAAIAHEGEPLELSASVCNSGDETSPASTGTFSVWKYGQSFDPPTYATGRDVEIPELAPGQCEVVAWEGFYLAEGRYDTYLVADPYQQLFELSELDNVAANLNIDVQAPR
jgi:hypothetical protein